MSIESLELIREIRESGLSEGMLDHEILSKSLRLYLAVIGRREGCYEEYLSGGDLVDLGYTLNKVLSFGGRPFTLEDLISKLYPEGRIANRWELERSVGGYLRTMGFSKKQRRVNGKRAVFWFQQSNS